MLVDRGAAFSQPLGQQAPPWAREEQSIQKPMIRRIAAPALAALTLAASSLPMAAGAQPNLKAIEQAAEKRLVTQWEQCFMSERNKNQPFDFGACVSNFIGRFGW
jgi:hypothetical protein